MNPLSAASGVSKVGQVQHVTGGGAANRSGGAKGSFGGLVKQFVEQTNSDQVASDLAVKDLVAGKTDNVQQVVMAVANAEMSFQLFMEIRNKLIDSYNELMRMQF